MRSCSRRRSQSVHMFCDGRRPCAIAGGCKETVIKMSTHTAATDFMLRCCRRINFVMYISFCSVHVGSRPPRVGVSFIVGGLIRSTPRFRSLSERFRLRQFSRLASTSSNTSASRWSIVSSYRCRTAITRAANQHSAEHCLGARRRETPRLPPEQPPPMTPFVPQRYASLSPPLENRACPAVSSQTSKLIIPYTESAASHAKHRCDTPPRSRFAAAPGIRVQGPPASRRSISGSRPVPRRSATHTAAGRLVFRILAALAGRVRAGAADPRTHRLGVVGEGLHAHDYLYTRMGSGNRTVGRRRNRAASPTTARSAAANAGAVAGRVGLTADRTEAAKAAAGDMGRPRRPTRRRRIRRVTPPTLPAAR